MICMLSSPLVRSEIIIHDLVRKCVKFSHFSSIIFILDLALNYIDKPQVFLGTNCAPLEVDLFSFCYERDFMLSLLGDNQSEVIEAFSSISRYLDDLLNIDNYFFDKWSVVYTLQNFS